MSKSTTYAELTHLALEAITRARATTNASHLPDAGSYSEASWAHRDLTAALTHLGRTLAGPGGEPPDLPLIERLEAVACTRDWAAPLPASEPGKALTQGARLTRAAADLWSTHHTATGAPRSPEAARLRHPAVLGAANRGWKDLVAAAADTCAALDARAEELGLEGPVAATGTTLTIASYPRPEPSGPESPAARVAITVARPAVRTAEGPMAELSDRVDRLRHLAWSMANHGIAPAHVLRNLAATGLGLSRAAAQSSRDAMKALPRGPRSGDLRIAADCAAQRSEAWRIVAGHVAALRTPDSTRHSIQIERIQIERLLKQVTRAEAATPLPSTAEDLVRLTLEFDEVARLNALALRKAHSRGDVLIAGRAVPRELLAERDDLLRARLTNIAVRAPQMSVRRIERAYRAVTGPDLSQVTPGADPPAA